MYSVCGLPNTAGNPMQHTLPIPATLCFMGILEGLLSHCSIKARQGSKRSADATTPMPLPSAKISRIFGLVIPSPYQCPISRPSWPEQSAHQLAGDVMRLVTLRLPSSVHPVQTYPPHTCPFNFQPHASKFLVIWGRG